MPLPTTFLYLTEEEVAQTMTVPQAIDLARKGIQPGRGPPKRPGNSSPESA